MKRAGPPTSADYARIVRAERIMVDALNKLAAWDDPYNRGAAEFARLTLRDAYPGDERFADTVVTRKGTR